MSYLFPFVNVSFLIMGAVRQLLMLEFMQIPAAVVLYYYHKVVNNVLPIEEKPKDSSVVRIFVVSRDGLVRQIQEVGLAAFDDEEHVHRLVTFYSKAGRTFAVMTRSPEETASIIENILSTDQTDHICNDILAAECPEIDKDITDVFAMYAGPAADFHAPFTPHGFDALAMCDINGVLVLPPDAKHIKVIHRSDLTERDIKLPLVLGHTLPDHAPDRTDHNSSNPTSSDDFVITDGSDADDESVGSVGR